MRFEINKANSGLFQFRFLNDERTTLLQSEPYENLENCVAGIQNFVPVAAISENYAFDNENGKHFFQIIDENGLVATSVQYDSEAEAANAATYLHQDAFQNTDFEVIFEETTALSSKIGFASKLDTYVFDYLSTTNIYGIETFQNTNNNQHYYHFNDASGTAVLFSQGYGSTLSRDGGVRSVLNNLSKAERIEYIQNDTTCYFIVKSQNAQEIARSKNFTDKASAESSVVFLQGYLNEFVEKYKKAEKKNTRDTSLSNQYHIDVASTSGKKCFETFKSTSNKLHYFHCNDANGNAILFSQGYSSGKARDGGVVSVIKSFAYSDRVIRKEDEALHYFVIKAGNKQEIARSRNFDTAAIMESAIAWVTTNYEECAVVFGIDISAETSKKTNSQLFNIHFDKPVVSQTKSNTMSQDPQQVDRREDDYLGCLEYVNRTEATEFFGIVKFAHASNGKNYFSWNDTDGSVILRSEGYPTESGRDNGAVSVNKNREIEERYSVEEKFGKFFTVLKAGNHQEIARSCAQDTEAAALALFPAARAAAKAAAEEAALAAAAAKVAAETAALEAEKAAAALAAAPIAVASEESKERANDRHEDNYLACREYNRQDVASEHAGLYAFTHESGEHFFTWTNDNGEVLMRSESYPSTGARDNGLASVAKNREIKERFKIEEKMGHYFMVLKAGNHQEIARSCPYKDLSALYAAFPIVAAPALEIEAAPVVEEVAVVAPAIAAVAAVAAVVDVPEVVIEEVAVPEVVVEAVPVVEEVAVAAPVIAAVAAVAAVVDVPEVVAPVEVVAPAPAKVIVDDDYLACKEYEGHKVNDKSNNVALFKHSNGQFYFAVYNADGSVRLRSEGFDTGQERDSELSGVLKNLNNPDMYTRLTKGEYHIDVLKDKTGREVGRSCMQKDVVAAAPVAIPAVAAVAAVAAIATQVELPKVELPKVDIPAPVVAAAPKIEAVAPVIEEAAGGFKLWWLLPLLLIPLLWLMCKNCKSEAPAAVVPAAKVVPAAPVAPEPAKTKLAVKSFLPVVLYFDNDRPDGNTMATRTQKTYSETYDAYYSQRELFATQGDGKATTDFFTTDVKKGMDDLQKLAAALVEITKSGEKVNLEVRGFASPLAKNGYNQALTGRRVSSIENYLSTYADGALAKFIKDGSIKLTTKPAGEETAKTGVSDNAKDKKKSVYSVGASSERRVEIVGIQ